jgi:hypothetical protein
MAKLIQLNNYEKKRPTMYVAGRVEKSKNT